MTARYAAVAIGHTGRGDFRHNLHLAFKENPNVRLIAVADPDEAGRAKAKAASGAERAHADYQQMLSRERPDLVVIAAHHFDRSREEQFLAACESGARGILVEKPIASNLPAADRMMAAADQRGIRVVVAHRSRETPHLWWARAKMESGEFGRLRLMRGQGKADHRAGAYDTMVLGTHIFDQMRFFAGDVAFAWGRVTCDGRDVTPADFFEGEEGTGLLAGNGLDAYYAFHSGVAGLYESYRASDGSKANQCFGLDLYFERAIIALRNLPLGEVYVCSDGVLFPQPQLGAWRRVRLPDWPQEPADYDANPEAVQAHARACQAASNRAIGEELVRCIEVDREPERASSGHDAVAALEMILAPHESQRTGDNVLFPPRDREQPNAGIENATKPGLAVEQQLLRIGAGHLQGTPEWELKAAQVRHVWEDTEHADWLRQPPPQLRCNLAGINRLVDGPLGRFLELAPSQVWRYGQLFMMVGTAGSFGILQTTPQMMLNVLDHGFSIQAAIEAPRFCTMTGYALAIEARSPPAVLADLERRGREVQPIEPWTIFVGKGRASWSIPTAARPWLALTFAAMATLWRFESAAVQSQKTRSASQLTRLLLSRLSDQPARQEDYHMGGNDSANDQPEGGVEMSAGRYFEAILPIVERLGTDQLTAIERAGELIADAIAGGHRAWVAKTTHCLHDEATGRAGGLMAVHILDDPIDIEPGDAVLIGTNAGTTFLTVETAMTARERGASVIVLTQMAYECHPDVVLEHPSRRRLHEFADVLIDLGGQYGDGELALLDTGLRILPSSGVAAMVAMWMAFGEAVRRLIEDGKPPLIWQSLQIPGAVSRNTRFQGQYHRTHIGYSTTPAP